VYRLNSNGDMLLAPSGPQRAASHLWANGKLFSLSAAVGPRTTAVDLNEKGDVLLAASAHDLALWSNGKTLPVNLHADWLNSAGFNDLGVVIGTEDTGRTRVENSGDVGPMRRPIHHATLLSQATKTDLNALPDENADSAGIDLNDAGQVVAISGNRAFLWEHGNIQDLGVLPGYHQVRPAAINKGGVIVGTLTGEQDVGGAIWGDAFQQPFLWNKGHIYALGTLPDATKTYALGINDSGQVVGNVFYMHAAHSYQGKYVPLLWENGRMYKLNELVKGDWTIVRAFAINNRGQIAVEASRIGPDSVPDPIGMHHVVALLSPVGRGKSSKAVAPKPNWPERQRLRE
jgi:uncharacterized membrane protein